MAQIASATVERMTSAGLTDFKNMIADAKRQREEIIQDLRACQKELKARERELKWKDSFVRPLFKKRIAELVATVSDLRREINELNAWFDQTRIEVTFHAGDQASQAYGAIVRAYEACRQSAAIWDITSERATNRVAERSEAGRTIDRRRVTFEYDDSDLLRFDGRALRLSNANGDDLMFYPGILLVPRSDGQFALIDIREITLEYGATSFIETERVPPDSQVVGHSWAYANKNGTPDRRFANNYQIPVCEYGRLCFRSKSGLNEEFQVSNAKAAIALGVAFDAYQRALRSPQVAPPPLS